MHFSASLKCKDSGFPNSGTSATCGTSHFSESKKIVRNKQIPLWHLGPHLQIHCGTQAKMIEDHCFKVNTTISLNNYRYVFLYLNISAVPHLQCLDIANLQSYFCKLVTQQVNFGTRYCKVLLLFSSFYRSFFFFFSLCFCFCVCLCLFVCLFWFFFWFFCFFVLVSCCCLFFYSSKNFYHQKKTSVSSTNISIHIQKLSQFSFTGNSSNSH